MSTQVSLPVPVNTLSKICYCGTRMQYVISENGSGIRFTGWHCGSCGTVTERFGLLDVIRGR